jgi:dTDP-4-dehydrorhamnose 3,5-epimerase
MGYPGESSILRSAPCVNNLSPFAPMRRWPRRMGKFVRMKIDSTDIPGVLVFEPKVFGDERGFFLESFNQRQFNATVGQPVAFVQDNHSRSARGVLRGLHFQRPPHAQGKLVRVSAGAVFDVAVDIRPGSTTFGRWVGVELSAQNHRQMWIPAGLAHGFLVLSDSADFLYKTTDYYAPRAECAVRWDDPDLAIAWPDIGVPPTLSAKDAAAPQLKDVAP